MTGRKMRNADCGLRNGAWLAGLAAWLMLCVGAFAQELAPVTLEWDYPAPEADVAAVRVYVGTTTDSATLAKEVAPSVTQAELMLPKGVIHYAIVEAVDTRGVASKPSNILAFKAFLPGEGTIPSAPVNLRVQGGFKAASATIETSPDLKEWVPVYANLPVGEVGVGARFFRLTVSLR